MTRLSYPILVLSAISLGGLPLLPAAARAALDPEPAKPYQLEIVLRCAENRSLTDLFKAQVEQGLHDSLQGAYGPLVQVKVIHEHPRLAEIEKKGLGPALDEWNEVTDKKTHFIFLDYVDGQYEVVGRQHDGITGLSSPVVRREQTRDREAVVKLIGELVVKDFGLAATVVKSQADDLVELAFRGSGLGTPPDGWPRKGEVFALARLARGGSGMQGSRVAWALVRLDEDVKDGAAGGTVFYRHAKPLAEGGGVAGYRCLRLATTSAPLHVRMVKLEEGRPFAERGLRIQVNHNGFGEDEPDKVEGATDEDGFLDTGQRTREKFSRVAFVRVVGADGRDRAHIPIPICDDRTVVCTLTLGQDVVLDPGAVRRQLWVKNLYRGVRGQEELFKELRQMIANPEQRAKALATAEAGHKRLQEELLQFQQMRAALQAAGVKVDLSEGDQHLSELQKGQAKLLTFINQQRDIQQKEKDQTRAWQEMQSKSQEALLREGECDFARAIELYEQAATGSGTDPKLLDHLKQLKDTWKIKDEKHAEARRFVYEVWPNYEAGQMAARSTLALDALHKCKEVSDTLTPQKLLKVALAHADKLREQASKLKPEDNQDDQKRAAQLAAESAQLAALIREAAAYLKETVK